MSRRVSNEPEDVQSGNVVTTLALAQIKVNEVENLRRADPKKIDGLANSIRKNGLLQGLIVSEIPPDQLNGEGYSHQLRAAYRRYNALSQIEASGGDRGKAPDLNAIPVTVIPMDADPLSVNMTENGQREEVNYIDRATGAMKRLTEGLASGRGKSELLKEIAEDMGTSVGIVHILLSLPSLRPAIQKRAANGDIPFKLLRVLPDLTEEQQDAALLDLENVGKGTATVTEVAERATKGKVRKNKKGQGRKKKADKGDSDGPTILSGKKALLVVEEAVAEIDSLVKAENVTVEQVAACREAKGILKVFAKVLNGGTGGQALGRQLTKKMIEE